jgi:nucleoside-diphosphate-sugar epimerase
MLTYQALAKKQITVFGGNQIRPNIHIKDMVRVYDFFLTNKKIKTDFYNAGFENISIKDLAYKINKIIPSKIKIVSSNDPRSYRQSSKKLLSTGFISKYSVEDAILDLKQRYRLNNLVSLDKNYNVKWMKLIKIDGKRN